MEGSSPNNMPSLENYKNLHLACENGDYDVIKNFFDKFSENQQVISHASEDDYIQWCQSVINRVFIKLCIHNHVKLARRFSEEFNVDRSNDILFTFSDICENGNIDDIEWFDLKFKLDNTQVNKKQMFLSACQKNRLDVAKWLKNKFNYEHDLNFGRIFEILCGNGSLEIVQWLTTEFSITRDDLKMHLILILQSICINGHLNVAQWFIKEFEITRIDVLGYKVMVGDVCINIDLAEWITEIFKITRDDILTNCYPIFNEIYEKNTILGLKWFIAKFKITRDDIQRDLKHILESSFSNGSSESLDYFVKELNIVREDIITNIHYILLFMCKSNTLNTIKWFAQYFKIKAQDIQYPEDILDHALQNKRCEGLQIVKWFIVDLKIADKINDLE